MMTPLRVLLACTLLAPSIHSSSYADKIQNSIYEDIGLSIDKTALVNTYHACGGMRDAKSQNYNPHGVRTCYEEVATKGFIPAQYALAWLFEMGEGGEKNLHSARSWYLMAATQQDYTTENTGVLDIYYQEHMDRAKTWAQFRLGRMLALGEGGNQDLYAARAWLEIASNRGYEPMINNVLRDVEKMISERENQLQLVYQITGDNFTVKIQ